MEENKQNKEESSFSELLLQGGKFGVGGVFKMIKVIVFFSTLNIVLFIYFMFN